MKRVKILLLADTHLGFDLPVRPRVKRLRRGPSFFRNYWTALGPAFRGEVDLVVHGGDLLYRSRVRPDLVADAFAPLKEVADRGVPVFIVPGNHERSQIPCGLLGVHPDVFLFDRPRTFLREVGGLTVALGGFPNVRRGVRDLFKALLEDSALLQQQADIRLLCLHQSVEGARVGPGGYTFRDGPDVVGAADVPDGVTAVLAGHIHRSQVLTAGLSGRPMPPVFYPGSIERTSVAERNEEKGFLTLEIGGRSSGRVRWRFHVLPTVPVVAWPHRGRPTPLRT